MQHVENPESTVVRVSGIHLKPYCTPVKKGNDSCTREKRKNTCSKEQPEVVDLDKIDSDRVWEQLNSPSLMRLWGSGADELHYDAHEDDEIFDASCDHYLFTCTNTGISLITLGNITGFKQRRVFT